MGHGSRNMNKHIEKRFPRFIPDMKIFTRSFSCVFPLMFIGGRLLLLLPILCLLAGLLLLGAGAALVCCWRCWSVIFIRKRPHSLAYLPATTWYYLSSTPSLQGASRTWSGFPSHMAHAAAALWPCPHLRLAVRCGRPSALPQLRSSEVRGTRSDLESPQ